MLKDFSWNMTGYIPKHSVEPSTNGISQYVAERIFQLEPEPPAVSSLNEYILSALQEKNLIYLHFTMDDNLSLSEAIKARYKTMYAGVFYDRYILGLWKVAEGIIYDMFDEAVHVVKMAAVQLIPGNRYVSCDYGTQNATVFLLWNKGMDKVWYCTKEYYYSGRDTRNQKTDAEYASDLKEWLCGTKIKAVIVDPAAASFIAELRKQGFVVIKARNDVLDGIRFVATLLSLKLIRFYEECKNTRKEFASYSWDSKAADRGEDKPVKENDHCMDAVRYFCYTVLYRQKAVIKSKAQHGIR